MTSAAPSPATVPTAPRWRGRILLNLSLLLLAVTWLCVLPALSRQPMFQRVIERNRHHGVNANAMYYTELEGVRFLHLSRDLP